MTTFVIECWNPRARRYMPFWWGRSEQHAWIMFQKPYYQGQTRRLIKTTTTLLQTTRRSRG